MKQLSNWPEWCVARDKQLTVNAHYDDGCLGDPIPRSAMITMNGAPPNLLRTRYAHVGMDQNVVPLGFYSSPTRIHLVLRCHVWNCIMLLQTPPMHFSRRLLLRLQDIFASMNPFVTGTRNASTKMSIPWHMLFPSIKICKVFHWLAIVGRVTFTLTCLIRWNSVTPHMIAILTTILSHLSPKKTPLILLLILTASHPPRLKGLARLLEAKASIIFSMALTYTKPVISYVPASTSESEAFGLLLSFSLSLSPSRTIYSPSNNLLLWS